MKSPENYSQEQIKDLNKSRKASDKELREDGAKSKKDEIGHTNFLLTDEQKVEIKNVVENSEEYLNNLLKNAENIATTALTSEKQVDDLIEKQKKSKESLSRIESERTSFLQEIENLKLPTDLKQDDYERLIQEGMIDKPYADRMKKMDDLIAKFGAINYPSSDVEEKLKQLSITRQSLQDDLKSQIEQKRQEISTRREELKNQTLEKYKTRKEDLEKTISEIESNPLVIERFNKISEHEKKAFEIMIMEKNKEIIQEVSRCAQSLSVKHLNSFKRMGDIIGNNEVGEELITILDGDRNEIQRKIDKIRGLITNSIIDGEGEKQLNDPREIVPWKGFSTSVNYGDAIDFLRSSETKRVLENEAVGGNNKAEKLLKQQEQIIKENTALKFLVGPQWLINKNNNKKYLGIFWAAFETRKINDIKGITEARKKERIEAQNREIALKTKMKELVDKGGFIVEAPHIKTVNGRKIHSTERGVIRLEREVSKKGNNVVKVVETIGITDAIKVGDTSPLNLSSFPGWVRKGNDHSYSETSLKLLEELMDLKK